MCIAAFLLRQQAIAARSPLHLMLTADFTSTLSVIVFERVLPLRWSSGSAMPDVDLAS